MNAVPVELAGADVWQVTMPAERGSLGKIDPRLFASVLEEAKLDPLRDLTEEREVGPGAVEACPQGVGLSRPYVHA
jgi:hypothetical protein